MIFCFILKWKFMNFARTCCRPKLSCPNFQVFSSPFSKVDDLLSEHRAKNVQREKIFQLQSMSNAIICIDQRFANKHSSVSSPTSIFDFDQCKWKWNWWKSCKIDSILRNTTTHVQFFKKIDTKSVVTQVTAEDLQSFNTVLTLELHQYRKSGSTSS